MSVLSKILTQMSAKIGKRVWVTERPQGLPQKTMLIGIDFYHKLVSKKKTCIGVVATMDKDFTQYYSRTLITTPGEQQVKGLQEIMQDCVQQYYKQNKQSFPETIIVYRDGLGDSQIGPIINSEINAIKSCLTSIHQQYQPQLAYIVINKKINQRFFSTQAQGGAGRGGKGRTQSMQNPESGTVVSEGITSPFFDFFLSAQQVT